MPNFKNNYKNKNPKNISKNQLSSGYVGATSAHDRLWAPAWHSDRVSQKSSFDKTGLRISVD